MPKKSVVNKTAVFEVLCASKEAVKKKNWNISTPSDDIWQNLCKELGEKMTPIALHNFVKLNRHSVWAALDYSNERILTQTAVTMTMLLSQAALLFKTKAARLSMWSSHLNSGYIWFQMKSHTKRMLSKKKKEIHHFEARYMDSCSKPGNLERD